MLYLWKFLYLLAATGMASVAVDTANDYWRLLFMFSACYWVTRAAEES